MPDYDIVTFDCYGTLIDWETGISTALQRAASEDGVTLQREEVLAAYASHEPLVEQSRYLPYREVLGETALHVAEQLGWKLDPSRAHVLADSLPSWQPFPDTNPALERMRAAGIRLGLLSNIDDDLIALTRRHFTVDFDLVITAQQVQSYKPGHAHFRTAKERLGDTRWLHAAQSDYHDIVPTNYLGIPNAWINRLNEKPLPGGTPFYEFRDLTGLADWLTSRM